MGELFGRDKSVVGKHLRNVFATGELKRGAVAAKNATTAADGKTYRVEYFNLDAILSVGYRVNSKRGTQFRIWATATLREHLLSGYTLNERRLREKGLGEMEQAVGLLARTLERHELVTDEGRAVLDVVERWRQVLPWVHPGSGNARVLSQARGSGAAILNHVAAAHERCQGSLARLRRDRRAWPRLVKDVGRVISVMPLWKLQTVGRDKLDFLYPNVGSGTEIRLHGEAVYCLRRFRGLIGDLAETAWARFVRRLPQNQALEVPKAVRDSLLEAS
jgi:hypothetical protein